MSTNRLIPWLVLASVLLSGCLSMRKAPAPLPPPAPKALGSVYIDAGRREVLVTGFVNQVSGPVELLACGPAGKTHESVLVLMVEPQDMHLALLLLGLKHGPPMAGVGMGPPQGDPVHLDVVWDEQGTTRTLPAEQLLRDVQTRQPVRHEAWIFNGSMIEEGRLKALEEESLITTHWDPWSLINIAADIGSDDERVVVNTNTVPPLHQPVTLVIRSGDRR
jgi:hypothetical protein